MKTTKVVNLNKEHYDVYIGRGSIWGNPFTHIKDRNTLADYIVDTRDEAIERYESYLLSNEDLMGRIMELDGKTLGCFCKPDKCHGNIIAKTITSLKLKAALKVFISDKGK